MVYDPQLITRGLSLNGSYEMEVRGQLVQSVWSMIKQLLHKILRRALTCSLKTHMLTVVTQSFAGNTDH